MRKTLILIVLMSIGCPAYAAPPVATLINVKKISDEAPHSAFTDLVYWHNQFVCAFREGRAHVSTDGRIKVLTSADGETWKTAAVLTLEGFDLRDAGLSITPDDRLMLIGGASPRKEDSELAPTGSFVAFSDDGVRWTEPQIVSEPGMWLWRVTWHDGKAYGVSYPAGADVNSADLVTSDDGIHFRELAPKMYVVDDGRPTEAVVRFGNDGTAYCLQRRDTARQRPRLSAFLGVSRPPYTDWKWHDLNVHVGGPALIQLPSGTWLAAGRFFEKDGPKTELAWLNAEDKSIQPILKFTSGGDTSYPGLVWHDDVLWMSFYSSHEGKGCIYVAKVKID